MQRFQNPGNFSACREFGNLGFGIRNSAQGIRNSASDWNPESKFHGLQRIRDPIPGVRNPQRGIQNPKTVLDNLIVLTWAKLNFNIVIK